MAKGIVKRDTLTKDTLLRIARIAGISAAIVIASSSPYFLSNASKHFFKDASFRERKARARKLRELERRKLISFQHIKGGEVKITLTKQGKTFVRQYDLDTLTLTPQIPWDKQWRLVMYDIPHTQRKASNALRHKLKQMGLFPLQRSVWVSPYECLAELEFIYSVFNISIDDTLCYLYTNKIPNEHKAKKFFNLT